MTAASGTAAARINGITIHAASQRGSERFGNPSVKGPRVDGQKRMDWQEKVMLLVDEVSMLGAKTSYSVNKQICALQGCEQDFGGTSIVVS